MIARIQKSMKDKDQGFTLIELLVVMIIIGILAAIAVPVFLSQRAKAQDTAAKSDISTIGKEIATYYVDNAGLPPDVAPTTGANPRYEMTIGTKKTDLGRVSVTNPVITKGAGITNQNWCVQLAYDNGQNPVVSYSAAAGLRNAVC